jgi:hypothetical protein
LKTPPSMNAECRTCSCRCHRGRRQTVQCGGEMGKLHRASRLRSHQRRRRCSRPLLPRRSTQRYSCDAYLTSKTLDCALSFVGITVNHLVNNTLGRKPMVAEDASDFSASPRSNTTVAGRQPEPSNSTSKQS